MSLSRVAFPNLKYSHYTIGWETLLEVETNLQNSYPEIDKTFILDPLHIVHY